MKDKLITFRASEETCKTIEQIMDRWLVDRTTVMVLAVYALHVHLSQNDYNNLYEIVDALQSQAPEDMQDFMRFSWGAPRIKKG